MDKSTRNILIGVVVLALIGFAMWWWIYSKKSSSMIKNYASMPVYNQPISYDENNLQPQLYDGMLMDDSYDLVALGHTEPQPIFTELVSQDNPNIYMAQNAGVTDNISPMQRLEKIQGKSLMPHVSTHITPYNIDICNPASHKYTITPTTTNLKSRFRDYSFSSMLRGDVPIVHHPDVALITKTQQDINDARVEGLFTQAFADNFRRLSGNC